MDTDEVIGGCELHEVIKSDPLELGAVLLETDEWAYPVDPMQDQRYGVDLEDVLPDMPVVGDKVLILREDDRPYWIGTMREILKSRAEEDDYEDMPHGRRTHGIDCGCGFDCDCEEYDPAIHGPLYDENGNLIDEDNEGEEW